MLHEFLEANRSAIVIRTQEKVAQRPAPRATDEELANGVPFFLDQLIVVLRATNGSSSDIEKSALLHGRGLRRRGFTVAQVVHDYGGVCQAVTELAGELKAPITAGEFNIFNRCLDDAIAQAVTEYAQQREDEITEEGKTRWGELAHELRNALGTATLAFQMVSTGAVAARGSTSALLGRSLARLTDLVNSSVAELRIESGTRTPERILVAGFIEEVEVGASMAANASGLTLAVSPVEPGLEVRADRPLLAAAVANLLQNAFKFTRPEGHVLLTAVAAGERVLIEVSDECGGLAVGDTEELFRQFERRKSSRTGLGLGLSISRKSIRADNGEIRVRDKAGVGCVFTIDLPRLLPAA